MMSSDKSEISFSSSQALHQTRMVSRSIRSNRKKKGNLLVAGREELDTLQDSLPVMGMTLCNAIRDRERIYNLGIHWQMKERELNSEWDLPCQAKEGSCVLFRA